MGRKGDMPRGSNQGQLMARYAVVPQGGGTYGMYDRTQQKFTEYFSGRGARQKADRKWRQIINGEVSA